jgi:CheY-like chemotaxis protein
VKIYLPRLTKALPLPAAPAENPPPPSGLPRAQPDETILLVEDNDSVRDYATTALAELGYRVIAARDADDALQAVERGERIDLLFTDVVLGSGPNGRELAGRIGERRAGLPVLFTTGYTRNAIVHHGRLDPGVHLLDKPFTQQDLARKIRELIDKNGAPPQ